MRVCLCEPNASIRSAVQTALLACGVAVDCVSSAEELICACTRGATVVLVDDIDSSISRVTRKALGGIKKSISVVDLCTRTSPLRVQMCAPTSGSNRNGLTKRELEALRLIGEGYDNLKAAATLGIAEKTFKSHVGSLYRKLQVENRSQLVRIALTGPEANRLGVAPIRSNS